MENPEGEILRDFSCFISRKNIGFPHKNGEIRKALPQTFLPHPLDEIAASGEEAVTWSIT